MAFRFQTRTLLYLTACVGCWITCTGAVIRYFKVGWDDAFSFTFATSPLWLPMLVLSYACGSKRFNARTFVAFVCAGPFAFGAFRLIGWILDGR
jgi:hypothetical protein